MPAMGLIYTMDYSFNDRYRAFYRNGPRGCGTAHDRDRIAIDRWAAPGDDRTF